MIAYYIGGSQDLTKRRLATDDPPRYEEFLRPVEKSLRSYRPSKIPEMERVVKELYVLTMTADPRCGEYVAIYTYLKDR